MKQPICKVCGNVGHYASFCFKAPKKMTLRRTPIRAKVATNKPVRHAKINAHSKSIRKKLIKEADRVFSIYIRKKSSVNGQARCVTCGYRDKWQLLENGHYISRRYVQIRWDEMNCNVQCKRCNQTMNGNLVEYKKYLERKYGYDVTEMLKRRVATRGKVTILDIQKVIDKYS